MSDGDPEDMVSLVIPRWAAGLIAVSLELMANILDSAAPVAAVFDADEVRNLSDSVRPLAAFDEG